MKFAMVIGLSVLASGCLTHVEEFQQIKYVPVEPQLSQQNWQLMVKGAAPSASLSEKTVEWLQSVFVAMPLSRNARRSCLGFFVSTHLDPIVQSSCLNNRVGVAAQRTYNRKDRLFRITLNIMRRVAYDRRSKLARFRLSNERMTMNSLTVASTQGVRVFDRVWLVKPSYGSVDVYPGTVIGSLVFHRQVKPLVSFNSNLLETGDLVLNEHGELIGLIDKFRHRKMTPFQAVIYPIESVSSRVIGQTSSLVTRSTQKGMREYDTLTTNADFTVPEFTTDYGLTLSASVRCIKSRLSRRAFTVQCSYGTLDVEFLQPNSSAAQVGFQVLDRLMSIDARCPSGRYTQQAVKLHDLQEIQKQDCSRITFVVLRNNASQLVTLPIMNR